MSNQPLKNLGLPPVPQGLKPILGFMQRADELKSQEPIVAYWALYHATQVGISARAKEPDAKNYLLLLLTLLEGTKKEIGPNDGIDNEVVAAAYVENFALKVFGFADSEDRAGKAARGTAKNFLVAANLLELLRVFDKANVFDSVDEKIRYAKWKAADISKALREGRKPTPGPANQEGQDSPELNITIEAASPEQLIQAGSTGGWPVPGVGTAPQLPGDTGDYRAVDFPVSPPASDPRRATVSDELEGHPPSQEESSLGDPNIGRLPTQFSPEPTPPQMPFQPSDPGPSISPSRVVPSYSETYTAPSIETSATPQPTILPHQQISQPTPPPPIPTQRLPAQVIHSPPTAPAPPPQLTPKQIAQAQKHCRFAISALDYEDFERAKKDLLDALKIIGG